MGNCHARFGTGENLEIKSKSYLSSSLTSFPSDELKAMFTDSNYIDDELVVQDGNLITSRGAGTTMPFAYKIVDVLGGDSAPVKKGMLYDRLLAGK